MIAKVRFAERFSSLEKILALRGKDAKVLCPMISTLQQRIAASDGRTRRNDLVMVCLGFTCQDNVSVDQAAKNHGVLRFTREKEDKRTLGTRRFTCVTADSLRRNANSNVYRNKKYFDRNTSGAGKLFVNSAVFIGVFALVFVVMLTGVTAAAATSYNLINDLALPKEIVQVIHDNSELYPDYHDGQMPAVEEMTTETIAHMKVLRLANYAAGKSAPAAAVADFVGEHSALTDEANWIYYGSDSLLPKETAQFSLKNLMAVIQCADQAQVLDLTGLLSAIPEDASATSHLQILATLNLAQFSQLTTLYLGSNALGADNNYLPGAGQTTYFLKRVLSAPALTYLDLSQNDLKNLSIWGGSGGADDFKALARLTAGFDLTGNTELLAAVADPDSDATLNNLIEGIGQLDADTIKLDAAVARRMTRLALKQGSLKITEDWLEKVSQYLDAATLSELLDYEARVTRAVAGNTNLSADNTVAPIIGTGNDQSGKPIIFGTLGSASKNASGTVMLQSQLLGYLVENYPELLLALKDQVLSTGDNAFAVFTTLAQERYGETISEAALKENAAKKTTAADSFENKQSTTAAFHVSADDSKTPVFANVPESFSFVSVLEADGQYRLDGTVSKDDELCVISPNTADWQVRAVLQAAGSGFLQNHLTADQDGDAIAFAITSFTVNDHELVGVGNAPVILQNDGATGEITEKIEKTQITFTDPNRVLKAGDVLTTTVEFVFGNTPAP